MIPLRHCTIEWIETGCVTTFGDGARIESYPHATPHYHVIAHRTGYGDDLMSYCREHDFFHSFCEQYFHDRPSPILWALAHGFEVAVSAYEETVVQACQRWVRSNERPIIGGVDWDGFKRRSLDLLPAGRAASDSPRRCELASRPLLA